MWRADSDHDADCSDPLVSGLYALIASMGPAEDNTNTCFMFVTLARHLCRSPDLASLCFVSPRFTAALQSVRLRLGLRRPRGAGDWPAQAPARPMRRVIRSAPPTARRQGASCTPPKHRAMRHSRQQARVVCVYRSSRLRAYPQLCSARMLRAERGTLSVAATENAAVPGLTTRSAICSGAVVLAIESYDAPDERLNMD